MSKEMEGPFSRTSRGVAALDSASECQQWLSPKG